MKDAYDDLRRLGVPIPPMWYTVEMECAVCGYEWTAQFPAEAPALECGGCGYMNPIPPMECLRASLPPADDDNGGSGND